MFEELGDIREIYKIYGTLGIIYQDLDQRDIANEMFNKAAELASRVGDVDDSRKYLSFIL